MMFLEGEEMYLTGEEREETLISTLGPATAAVLRELVAVFTLKRNIKKQHQRLSLGQHDCFALLPTGFGESLVEHCGA